MNDAQSTLTIDNAKRTVKETRYREFTEAEMYRPMSKLYDRVVDSVHDSAGYRWGWSLASNGFTHLIAAFLMDTNSEHPWRRPAYFFISAAAAAVGLYLIATKHQPSGYSHEKETMLSEFIDSEFTDDLITSSKPPVQKQATPKSADDGLSIS